MNVQQLLIIGSNELKKNNIPSFNLDSEILLSNVLKKDRHLLIRDPIKKIHSTEIIKYRSLINRRLNYEPISYITNKKEFWSKTFSVTSDTLIPRPETELMVEKLTKIIKKQNISILDIGTGTGCIIISLLSELNKAKGVGIDISKKALTVAQKNSFKFSVSSKVKYFNLSVSKYLKFKHDLIVSNPPYIIRRDIKNLPDDIRRFEPRIALDGGNDGLDLIRKVIYKSKEILKVNGILALEIGTKQLIKVSELLFKNNFRIEHKIKDYKDNIRCIIARKLIR